MGFEMSTSTTRSEQGVTRGLRLYLVDKAADALLPSLVKEIRPDAVALFSSDPSEALAAPQGRRWAHPIDRFLAD